MNAAALIAANIVAHSVDGQVAQHMVALAHERTIRGLAARLAEYEGTGAVAANGCRIFTVTLGTGELLVEAAYEPEEGDGWNSPHYPAVWSLMRMLVNGKWQAAGLLSEDTISDIELQIEEILENERNAAAESRAEARALDRMAA